MHSLLVRLRALGCCLLRLGSRLWWQLLLLSTPRLAPNPTRHSRVRGARDAHLAAHDAVAVAALAPLVGAGPGLHLLLRRRHRHGDHRQVGVSAPLRPALTSSPAARPPLPPSSPPRPFLAAHIAARPAGFAAPRCPPHAARPMPPAFCGTPHFPSCTGPRDAAPCLPSLFCPKCTVRRRCRLPAALRSLPPTC